MDCIVLDQGNTSIKWGLFQNNLLVEVGRISDEDCDRDLRALHSRFSLPFLYSSVRSEEQQLAFLTSFEFCRSIPEDYFPKYHYTSGTAGKDRLANVSGASHVLEGRDALIVDFGTCITYSVAKNNELFSGAIALGAQSRLRAMHEFTGQLPSLQLTEILEPFHNSTQGAMLSSVNFGIVSELKGYIEWAIEHWPDIAVVFTGTDSTYFAKQLNYRIFVELNLTLIGLYAISCANES
jgi:type III pantothenate kinase